MLAISNLNVTVHNQTLLQQVGFTLERGELLALTGASGSGKTTLIRAVCGVLKEPYRLSCDYLNLDGLDLKSGGAARWREQCGIGLGYIPQNPMLAFDPRMPLGRQMRETFRLKKQLSNKAAEELAHKTIFSVGLTDTARVLSAYPHELSGGMLQRAAIAICAGLETKYILADEPTASLDEKNRDAVFTLLKDTLHDTGILLITHDPELLARCQDNLLILLDGEIVERGSLARIMAGTQSAWVWNLSRNCFKLGSRLP